MTNQSRELEIRCGQVLDWCTGPDPRFTEFRPDFELYLAPLTEPFVFFGEKANELNEQIESSFAAPSLRAQKPPHYVKEW